MIQLNNIGVQYGERILFKNVSFQINPQDKIALIGRNGVGKSTLFNVITGGQSPDDGNINMQNGVQIGLLPQILTIDPSLTVREAATQAFSQLIALEEENRKLQKALDNATDFESKRYLELLDSFNNNLERLNHFEAGSMDKKIELVLKGLGFETSQFDQGINTLSGGWQMRVELAKLLLQQPELLLLDEPTNHLDIEAIIWLEQYISSYPNAAIIISHDRTFLRNTANRIIEIENGKTQDYNLPYDKYLSHKAEIQEKQEAAYKNQQKEIAQKERTIKRFMAKATKTSMAQSMQKQLNKIDRIELDAISQQDMRVEFLPVPRSGRTVLKGRGISKNYGENQVLKNIDFELERGDRVAIVGQNGQGKTTLSRILLDIVPATSGQVELGSQVSLGYYAQNQSDTLEANETILEYMELRAPEGMRTRVRSILGAFMFTGEDADKKIKVLSGGEKARLAFAQLLMQPINLLVLDEPTNHLDLSSKEVLKNALMDYKGTLLIISHDRDFLGGLTSKTLELRDQKMYTYLGDVNYFLNKREMDNLREVALYKKENNDEHKVTPGKSTLSNAERKALTKEIKIREKRILKYEEEISVIESQMAVPEFYDKEDAEAITATYAQLKEKLKDEENRWEQLIETLDNN